MVVLWVCGALRLGARASPVYVAERVPDGRRCVAGRVIEEVGRGGGRAAAPDVRRTATAPALRRPLKRPLRFAICLWSAPPEGASRECRTSGGWVLPPWRGGAQGDRAAGRPRVASGPGRDRAAAVARAGALPAGVAEAGPGPSPAATAPFVRGGLGVREADHVPGVSMGGQGAATPLGMANLRERSWATCRHACGPGRATGGLRVVSSLERGSSDDAVHLIRLPPAGPCAPGWWGGGRRGWPVSGVMESRGGEVSGSTPRRKR
jgi:hypothetical protein